MSFSNLATDTRNLLEQWIAYRRILDRVPGIAASISVDGECVLSKGFGYRNMRSKQPVDEHTVFRIASTTKVFTAVAIMQLVDRGLVQLDTPVSHYLEWFRSVKEPQLAEITVRQLLMHASGLKRDGNTNHQTTREFPDAEGLRSDIDNGILAVMPNEIFKYSNYGPAILGQLIEEIAGVPYAKYMYENIFAPLGMDRTFTDWNDQSNHLDNVATGYGREIHGKGTRLECPTKVELKAYAPAFGMCSTAHDLALFGRAMLDHNALLSRQSWREMLRTQWADGPENATWGLGFRTWKIDDRKIVGITGLFEGFGSFLAVDPDRRIIVVILFNALQPNATQTLGEGSVHAINYIFDNAQFDQSTSESESPDKFSGIFSSEWSEILIQPIGSTLYAFYPTTNRLFDDASKLEVTDDHSTRMKNDEPGGSIEEDMTFAFNSEGKARQFTIDGATRKLWSIPDDY